MQTSWGSNGHKVRIRKNKKQTFKPSFRVSTWGGRSGRFFAIGPHIGQEANLSRSKAE
jgi:hypothetical protein